MQHQPVLLHEVLEQLAVQSDGIYIDATFGRGGHSAGILEHLGEKGQLLAIDQDTAAIESATHNPLFKDDRFILQKGRFSQLLNVAKKYHYFGKVNGILLDLGVSSPQLDHANRGFSFLKNGPLDMRMDADQGMDAAQWINTATQQDIAHVIKTYGEERYANRIATAIINHRAKVPIKTTEQLAEIVTSAHPQWEKHKHPATRTFQAIRIFINRELAELTEALPQCLEILAIHGRLLVISFHSLEDRIVKNFIKTYGSHERLPRNLPLTDVQLAKHLHIKRINGVIKPSETEIAHNPRARSAMLRVIEKLK